MKAFTDISQSKKLAEILPLESADMAYWKKSYLPSNYAVAAYQIEKLQKGFEPEDIEYIPCWSLAALLGVLPIVYINNKKEICGPLHIDITDSETPFVLWYVNPLHKGSIVELKTKEYDNMIDACVEMIIKLKDLNLS